MAVPAAMARRHFLEELATLSSQIGSNAARHLREGSVENLNKGGRKEIAALNNLIEECALGYQEEAYLREDYESDDNDVLE